MSICDVPVDCPIAEAESSCMSFYSISSLIFQENLNEVKSVIREIPYSEMILYYFRVNLRNIFDDMITIKNDSSKVFHVIAQNFSERMQVLKQEKDNQSAHINSVDLSLIPHYFQFFKKKMLSFKTKLDVYREFQQVVSDDDKIERNAIKRLNNYNDEEFIQHLDYETALAHSVSRIHSVEVKRKKKEDENSSEKVEIPSNSDNVEKDDVKKKKKNFDSFIYNAIEEFRRYTKETNLVHQKRHSEVYGMFMNLNDVDFLKGRMDDEYDIFISGRSVISQRLFDKKNYTIIFDGFNFVDVSLSSNLARFLVSNYCRKNIDHLIIRSIPHDIDRIESEVSLIQAVPGAGKTTYIVDNFDSDINSVILTSTLETCADVKLRLKSKKKKIGKNSVRTIHSFLINSFKVDEMWLDEAMMQHVGMVFSVISLSQCAKVYIFGDKFQIPWVNRNPNFVPRFFSIFDYMSPTSSMNISYRCPIDVAYRLRNIYNKSGGIVSSNPVADSCKIIKNFSVDSLPKRPQTQYLSFTQSDKEKLIMHGFTNSLTVNEYQGRQESNVIIYRSSTNPQHSLFLDVNQAVSALTRHTKTLEYYTPVLTDALGQFIADQTDICTKVKFLKEVSVGAYDFQYKYPDEVANCAISKTFFLDTNKPIMLIVSKSLLGKYLYPSKRFNIDKSRFLNDIKKKKKNKFITDFFGMNGIECFILNAYKKKNIYITVNEKNSFGDLKVFIDYYKVKLLSIYNSNFLNKSNLKKKMYDVFNIPLIKNVDGLENGLMMKYDAHFNRSAVVGLIKDRLKFLITLSIDKDESIVHTNVHDFLVKNALMNHDYEEMNEVVDSLVIDNSVDNHYTTDLYQFQFLLDQAFPNSVYVDNSYDSYMVNMHEIDISCEKLNLNLYKSVFKEIPFMTMQPNIKIAGPIIRQKCTRELILALVKRNQNVPYVIGFSVETEAAMDMCDKMFKNMFHENEISFSPITVSVEGICGWLEKQLPGIVNKLDTDTYIFLDQLKKYSFDIKRFPKPDLTDAMADNYSALQTIVYHEKIINAIFCPVFKKVKERVKILLKDKFSIFTDMDYKTFAAYKMRYGMDDMYSLEVDISKYDKSQTLTALYFECQVMLRLGVESWIVSLWFGCHYHSLMKNRAVGLSFSVEYQRKSGDASTFIGNTLYLMACLNDCIDLSEVSSAIFSGDDSLIIANYLPSVSVEKLMYKYNLEAKLVSYKSMYFCSKFVIKNADNFFLLPDPVKLLIKLGRSDLLNDEHVEQYRVSFSDSVLLYDDDGLVRLLADAVVDRYKLNIDPYYIIKNMYYLAQPNNFKSLYYKPAGFQEKKGIYNVMDI